MELYPLPWLTLSIFESVVWGGRFELLYMLPFAVHYYTQGMVGFPDNSFIGISGGIKLPHAVRVDFIAYFDDMAFNDLIKLDFNTRLKFAFQTGVSWTPNLPYLARLELNGMVVTPYTYTHADWDAAGAGLPRLHQRRPEHGSVAAARLGAFRAQGPCQAVFFPRCESICAADLSRKRIHQRQPVLRGHRHDIRQR